MKNQAVENKKDQSGVKGMLSNICKKFVQINYRLRRMYAFIFLALVLLVIYTPLLLMFVFSFSRGEIGDWNGFTFDLYREFFTGREARRALINTFVIGIVAATLATCAGTFAAIGLMHLRGWKKRVVSAVNQLPLINATVVTGVAFMVFFIAVQFIPSGYATIIIAHTMLCIPFVILVVLPRYAQLNPNLYEVGLDLGSRPIGVMFKVVMPQLLPAIFMAFCLAFAISLDDFIITALVRDEVHTVSTYIFTTMRGQLQRREHLMAIASFMFMLTIGIVVLVLLYIKRQKKEKNRLEANLGV